MINLQKTFRFGKNFFKRVGRRVLNKHKEAIFEKGLNAKGKSFQSYAPYTAAYKRRKMAGKAAPAGQTQKSKSGTPDLVLTGYMKDTFNYVKAHKRGFKYGINNSITGQRMLYQGPEKKSRKRFVSTKADPTIPDMQAYIVQEMRNEIIKNIKVELRKNGMGYKVYTI